MSTEIQRYEFTDHHRGMYTFSTMDKNPEGDFVLFSDYEAKIKARDSAMFLLKSGLEVGLSYAKDSDDKDDIDIIESAMDALSVIFNQESL